jgi:hypothetical protein
MIRSTKKKSWWSRNAFIVSLLVLVMFALSAVGIMSVRADTQAQVCGFGDEIHNVDPYWINNNLWGQNTGSGSQCTWSNALLGSSLSWGTKWNWQGQNTVKSYVSVVLGWNFGAGYMVPDTGLPVQLSSNTNVNTNWSFSLSGGSNQNVSYDIWVDPAQNPTQPQYEIMLWLYHNGVQPRGAPGPDISIDGTTWTLWYDPSGITYTFVRDSNTTSSSLNINDFLQNLENNDGLSRADYLLSVQAGSEVFTGSGELDVSAYSTTIGGSGGGNGWNQGTDTGFPTPTISSCSTNSPTNTVFPTSTSIAFPTPTDTVSPTPISTASPQPSASPCSTVSAQPTVPIGGATPTSGVTLVPSVVPTPTATVGATGPIYAPRGKCVDVRGANSADATPVQLYDCNGTSEQMWTVEPDGTLQAFGKCLDIIDDGTAASTRVQLWPCNGGGQQKWVPQANGSLLNPQSGLCLDVPYADASDGNQLQIWYCNNQWMQVFQLP